MSADQTTDAASPQEGRVYSAVLTDRPGNTLIRAVYRRGYFYALDASGKQMAAPGSYPFAQAIHPGRVRIIADPAAQQTTPVPDYPCKRCGADIGAGQPDGGLDERLCLRCWREDDAPVPGTTPWDGVPPGAKSPLELGPEDPDVGWHWLRRGDRWPADWRCWAFNASAASWRVEGEFVAPGVLVAEGWAYWAPALPPVKRVAQRAGA